MSRLHVGGRVRFGLLAVLSFVLLAAIAGSAVVWEMWTSTLQSRWFSSIAEEVTWEVELGPSSNVLFPSAAPYDDRLGYSRLPSMIESASQQGLGVVRQATVSPTYTELVRERALYPIYHEKSQAGLTIVDQEGDTLSVERFPTRVFSSFDAIPPIVWRTLLFVENRSLLDPDRPLMNPAVEWPRLLRSSGALGLRFLGREGSVAGASTLATQLEKFRHSPEGRTSSPREKLSQMASASVRTYLDGPETMSARRRIVLDYLNSVPLAAQVGEGEVTGIGEGLWFWYGRELEEASEVLSAAPWTSEGYETEWVGSSRSSSADLAGTVYREILSLILSQRRPTFYLSTQRGREALGMLTDRYLGLLQEAGIISPTLANAARAPRETLRSSPPERSPVPFVERKAINAVRSQLLGLLDVPQLYDLDRTDLTAVTAIDAEAQRQVTDLVQRLADPEFVRARGLDGYRLLDRGDPSNVIYSVLIQERSEYGNLVRVQVDNLDAPFNLNESARLELGSTAKLRTLTTYLQLIAELHDAFSGLSPDSLRAIPLSERDPLARWSRAQVLIYPGITLRELLRRSLDRPYSANPGERFVTGGGVQSFSNFDATYDNATLSVATAFQQSVNLVFVRMMRDIVNRYIYRDSGSAARALEDPDSPLRTEYLRRFADREGTQFINRFLPKFEERERAAILAALLQNRRLSSQRTAWAYRSVVSDPSVDELGDLLQNTQTDLALTESAIRQMFSRADPADWDLQDLGYLSAVHPLELWLARYLILHPEATRQEIIQESADARQEVYRWLFRTSRQSAQDQRIRFLLEVEAFTEILGSWRALGYPFANIVPSLGTAIGSSGDRPAALAELTGIVLNDGIRLPTYRVEELRFAEGTPFETGMARRPVRGDRVMRTEVAEVLRESMRSVVQLGTARRASRVLIGPEDRVLDIGGKTGTGDNRYRTFDSAGRPLESRSVNRTSTFVFFVDERLFGVVTAYVPGEAADDYWFTSALPTQILVELAPVLGHLLSAS